MVETSNDRNGVVVNRPIDTREVHAIDSTRGIPNCLVKKRCSGENRCSEIHAKSGHGEQCFVLYSATSMIVGPKSGFLRRCTKNERSKPAYRIAVNRKPIIGIAPCTSRANNTGVLNVRKKSTKCRLYETIDTAGVYE